MRKPSFPKTNNDVESRSYEKLVSTTSYPRLFFILPFSIFCLFLAYYLVISSDIFLKHRRDTEKPKNNASYTLIGRLNSPKIIKRTAYFELQNGIYELGSITYSTNQATKPQISGAVGNLTNIDENIYFIRENKLKSYNYNSKLLTDVEWPESVSDLKNISGVEAVKIKENTYLLNIYDSSWFNYQTYIYKHQTGTFLRLQAFEGNCGIVYCGAPYMVKEVDANNVLLFQGGGDACWGAGMISLLNLDTMFSKTVLEHDSGCYDEKDSYVGLYKGNVVSAAHSFTSSSTYGETDVYESLNLINPITLEKTVILGYNDMPVGIIHISINEDNNSFLLYKSTELQKGYIYNLNDMSLSTETTLPEVTYDERYEEKANYYKEKEDVIPILDVKKASITGDSSMPNQLEVEDVNGIKAIYMTINDWDNFYKKHIKYDSSIQSCESNTEYYFQYAKLTDNKIEIIVRSKVPGIPLCNSKIQPIYKGVIDLQDGSVYLVE